MYKHLFSGVMSNDDIIFLRTKCPIEDYPIIDNIIRTFCGTQSISYEQMTKIINILTKLKYKEECNEYLENIKTMNNRRVVFTQTQQDVFNKIISTKPFDDSYIDLPSIEKPCPHCGQVNTAKIGTSYIVCGIDSKGIIPIGCGYCFNDWCFMCGKKLCKNWYKNELYNEKNRIHNGTCCHNHAVLNNSNYLNDYCRCSLIDIKLF